MTTRDQGVRSVVLRPVLSSSRAVPATHRMRSSSVACGVRLRSYARRPMRQRPTPWRESWLRSWRWRPRTRQLPPPSLSTWPRLPHPLTKITPHRHNSCSNARWVLISTTWFCLGRYLSKCLLLFLNYYFRLFWNCFVSACIVTATWSSNRAFHVEINLKAEMT